MNDSISIEEYKALQAQKEVKSKYNAKPVTVDGIKFPSHKEADYYGKLKLFKKTGELERFEMQVTFKFIINDILICSYRADFIEWWSNGEVFVTDTKGVITDVYVIKEKLMLSLYGITIKRV